MSRATSWNDYEDNGLIASRSWRRSLKSALFGLNHRAVFSRVRYSSRGLHLTNLLLLLTSALIPFPTALLSTALQHGRPGDATVALELYAAVGCLMCFSWLFLFHVLSLNPHILETYVEPTFFPREGACALFGIALYILGGIIVWALSSMLALMCFLAMPIFYGITSEGLVESRVPCRKLSIPAPRARNRHLRLFDLAGPALVGSQKACVNLSGIMSRLTQNAWTRVILIDDRQKCSRIWQRAPRAAQAAAGGAKIKTILWS
jgi:uncharacterized membrane protein